MPRVGNSTMAVPRVRITTPTGNEWMIPSASPEEGSPPYVPSSEVVYCPRKILHNGFIAQFYSFKIDNFDSADRTSAYFGDPVWAWKIHYVTSQNLTTVTLIAATCVDGILDPELTLSRHIYSARVRIIGNQSSIADFDFGNRIFDLATYNPMWGSTSVGSTLARHPHFLIECRLLFRDTNPVETNRLILRKFAESNRSGADMTDYQVHDPSTTRTDTERGLMSAQRDTVGSEPQNYVQPSPHPPDMPHFEFKASSEVPFKFVSELGVGSSSRVDEVEHSITKKRYARKSIRCHTSEAETVREIVLREVGVVQRLSHDHIVSVYCTYRELRSFNLLITPVAAGDLTWYLDKVSDENYPESSLELLRTWFACLTRALVYVHENKIRHKDIKPGNILVNGSNVLLTDFGIARDFINEFTSSTQNGSSAKTLMYCAPEVDDDDGQRNRSADVFSLGCVFVEMATVLAKKPVAEFYQMRKVGESHAYFRTLELVQSWMATHAILPYSRFIALMLSPNKVARPSAALVEMLIQSGGLDGKTGISCSHG